MIFFSFSCQFLLIEKKRRKIVVLIFFFVWLPKEKVEGGARSSRRFFFKAPDRRAAFWFSFLLRFRFVSKIARIFRFSFVFLSDFFDFRFYARIFCFRSKIFLIFFLRKKFFFVYRFRFAIQSILNAEKCFWILKVNQKCDTAVVTIFSYIFKNPQEIDQRRQMSEKVEEWGAGRGGG